MWVVGLTGGIGSGKSSACEAFTQLGITVVDTDLIAHELSAANSPLIPEIRHCFGDIAITQSGELNRANMRKLIFSDALAKKRLEQIFHPAIHAESLKQILATENKGPYCVLAVPLLFESTSFLSLTNYTVTIDCDESLQLQRVKQRNALDDKQIAQIISTQLPRNQRNQRADQVICNNGSLHELCEKVSLLHDFFLLKAK